MLWTVVAMLAIVGAILLISSILRRRETVVLQGTVECTTYKASSKIAGRIERMLVEQGQRVARGELLYVISTPELDAKLRQVEAAKNAAKALDQKALAGTRTQQITAARSLWQEAEAGAQLALRTYERVQRLYNQGVVPAQQYDQAKANYTASRSAAEAAKAQYDLALAGASREDKAAAAAQLSEAEAAVREVELYLSDAMVYSPVDGEVTTVVAEAGELIGEGYPAVALIDTTDEWVEFNVREDLLPAFNVGQQFEGYVPALGRSLWLEVSYIAVQADFATWSATSSRGGFDVRTFAVKARPTDGGEGLRPGMSVLVDYSLLK